MEVIRWYIVLQVLGLVGLPIAHRLFAALPSRGYLFAKPLALLLAGYAFWMAGIFGFVANSTPAAVFAVFLVALLAARFAWQDRDDLAQFVREQRGLIVATELVLLAFFLFGVIFRAYNPALNYTEKPMDLLFLNSMLRSPEQPPLDPWLSGFAISYYYFGYLLMSLLVRFASVSAGTGFNLALATVMGLTGAGAFSIVHDMISASRAKGRSASPRARLAVAVLGALFVALIGNLEGVVELMNAQNLGTPEFYALLNIKGLPPMHQSPTWFPDDNWWWWRASRVLATPEIEVIDEFPFFSFLIADLHPHVMALPFALMAVALALATLRQRPPPDGSAMPILPPLAWLYPLTLGALGFLNSWDFPTYTALTVAAYAVARHRQRGFTLALGNEVALFGLFVGGLGLALYLPFYLTFSSQASGIKFDLLTPRTTAPQLILFWGFFLLIVIAFAAAHARSIARQLARQRAAAIFAIACFFLFLFAALVQWWAAALALLIVGVAVPQAFRARPAERDPGEDVVPSTDGHVFAWLLLAVGFALVFVVEVVFIRDSFGTRMNTVFKFYYQAWVLIGIACAYAVYAVTKAVPAPLRAVWLGAGALLFAGTLYYPVAAFATQTNLLQNDDPTLDGTAYMFASHRGDAAAIEWLRENAPPGSVVLEAVGGQYSEYGRVSSQTGIPTLLGWGGHELQWRGNGDEAARREPVVQRIYTSPSVEEVRDLLKTYGVTHIFAGELERAKYGTNLPVTRMASIADKVYDKLGTSIYRVK